MRIGGASDAVSFLLWITPVMDSTGRPPCITALDVTFSITRPRVSTFRPTAENTGTLAGTSSTICWRNTTAAPMPATTAAAIATAIIRPTRDLPVFAGFSRAFASRSESGAMISRSSTIGGDLTMGSPGSSSCTGLRGGVITGSAAPSGVACQRLPQLEHLTVRPWAGTRSSSTK